MSQPQQSSPENSPKQQPEEAPKVERGPSVFAGHEQEYTVGKTVLIKRDGAWVKAELNSSSKPKAGRLTLDVIIDGYRERVDISAYAPPVLAELDPNTTYRVVQNGNQVRVVYEEHLVSGYERELSPEAKAFIVAASEANGKARPLAAMFAERKDDAIKRATVLAEAKEFLDTFILLTNLADARTITAAEIAEGKLLIARLAEQQEELQKKVDEIRALKPDPLPELPTYDEPGFEKKTPAEAIEIAKHDLLIAERSAVSVEKKLQRAQQAREAAIEEKKEDIETADKKAESSLKGSITRQERNIENAGEALEKAWDKIQHQFIAWYNSANETASDFETDKQAALTNAQAEITAAETAGEQKALQQFRNRKRQEFNSRRSGRRRRPQQFNPNQYQLQDVPQKEKDAAKKKAREGKEQQIIESWYKNHIGRDTNNRSIRVLMDAWFMLIDDRNPAHDSFKPLVALVKKEVANRAYKQRDKEDVVVHNESGDFWEFRDAEQQRKVQQDVLMECFVKFTGDLDLSALEQLKAAGMPGVEGVEKAQAKKVAAEAKLKELKTPAAIKERKAKKKEELQAELVALETQDRDAQAEAKVTLSESQRKKKEAEDLLAAYEAHKADPDHKVFEDVRVSVPEGERAFDFASQAKAVEDLVNELTAQYRGQTDEVKALEASLGELQACPEATVLGNKRDELLREIESLRSFMFPQDPTQQSFAAAFGTNNTADIESWLLTLEVQKNKLFRFNLSNQIWEAQFNSLAGSDTLSFPGSTRTRVELAAVIASSFEEHRRRLTVFIERELLLFQHEMEQLQKNIALLKEQQEFDAEMKSTVKTLKEEAEASTAEQVREHDEVEAGEAKADVLDFTPSQMEKVFEFMEGEDGRRLYLLREHLYGLEGDSREVTKQLFRELFDNVNAPNPEALKKMGISNWDAFVKLWKDRLAVDVAGHMQDHVARQIAAQTSREMTNYRNKGGAVDRTLRAGEDWFKKYIPRVGGNVALVAAVGTGAAFLLPAGFAFTVTFTLGTAGLIRGTKRFKRGMNKLVQGREDRIDQKLFDEQKKKAKQQLRAGIVSGDAEFVASFAAVTREVSAQKAEGNEFGEFTDAITAWTVKKKQVLRALIDALPPAANTPEEQERRKEQILHLIALVEILHANGDAALEQMKENADPRAIQKIDQLIKIMNGDSKAGALGSMFVGGSIGFLLDLGQIVGSWEIRAAARGVVVGAVAARVGWAKGERDYWEKAQKKQRTSFTKDIQNLNAFLADRDTSVIPSGTTSTSKFLISLDQAKAIARRLKRVLHGKASKDETSVLIFFDEKNEYQDDTGFISRIEEALHAAERSGVLDEEPGERKSFERLLDSMVDRTKSLEDTEDEKKRKKVEAKKLWKSKWWGVAKYGLTAATSAVLLGMLVDEARADSGAPKETASAPAAEEAVTVEAPPAAEPAPAAVEPTPEPEPASATAPAEDPALIGSDAELPSIERMANAPKFEIRGGKLLTATGDFLESLSDGEKDALIKGIRAEHPEWVDRFEARGAKLGFDEPAMEKYMEVKLLHKYQLFEVGKDQFGVEVRATSAGGATNEWTNTRGFDAGAEVEFVDTGNGYMSMRLVDASQGHDLTNPIVQNTGGSGVAAEPAPAPPEVTPAAGGPLTEAQLAEFNEIAGYEKPVLPAESPKATGAFSDYKGGVNPNNPNEYIITPTNGAESFTVSIEDVRGKHGTVDGTLALEMYREHMAELSAAQDTDVAAAQGGDAQGAGEGEGAAEAPAAAAATVEGDAPAEPAETPPEPAAEVFDDEARKALQEQLADRNVGAGAKRAAIIDAIKKSKGPVSTPAGTYRMGGTIGNQLEFVASGYTDADPVVINTEQMGHVSTLEQAAAGDSTLGISAQNEALHELGVIERVAPTPPAAQDVGAANDPSRPYESPEQMVQDMADGGTPTAFHRNVAFVEFIDKGRFAGALPGVELSESLKSQIVDAVKEYSSQYESASASHKVDLDALLRAKVLNWQKGISPPLAQAQ